MLKFIQMTTKRDITNLLVTQLKKVNGSPSVDNYPNSPYTFNTNVYNNVFDKFKYLDNINDFPTICIYNTTESRFHIGGGIKYASYTANIRGYSRDGNDSIAAADDLASDIEYVLMGFRQEACIVDCRVLSIETDEGLFSPFGICEIIAQITYEVDLNG